MEAALVKQQQIGNKLMRMHTLTQLEMMTRLMVVEGRETLSRMNQRFEGVCRQQETKIEEMKEALREFSL